MAEASSIVRAAILSVFGRGTADGYTWLDWVAVRLSHLGRM